MTWADVASRLLQWSSAGCHHLKCRLQSRRGKMNLQNCRVCPQYGSKPPHRRAAPWGRMWKEKSSCADMAPLGNVARPAQRAVPPWTDSVQQGSTGNVGAWEWGRRERSTHDPRKEYRVCGLFEADYTFWHHLIGLCLANDERFPPGRSFVISAFSPWSQYVFFP